MRFKKWWGSTVFKHCFIIQSFRPCTSFLVGLDAAHVVRPSGFPIVTMLGKVATQTTVSVGDFITMGLTIFFWLRIETALASSFSSLLLHESFEFLQLV
jgi:hypothetical protein